MQVGSELMSSKCTATLLLFEAAEIIAGASDSSRVDLVSSITSHSHSGSGVFVVALLPSNKVVLTVEHLIRLWISHR